MANTIDLVITKGGLKAIEFTEIGEVNVIIGPNNSGKTTLFRALLSRTFATQTMVQGPLSKYADKSKGPLDGKVQFRAVKTNTEREIVKGRWYRGQAFASAGFHSDHIANAEEMLRTSSSRFDKKIFCLWHRRKSDYQAPIERVDELDSEAIRMVARLAQIRHGSEQGASINEFVAERHPWLSGLYGPSCR